MSSGKPLPEGKDNNSNTNNEQIFKLDKHLNYLKLL